MENLNLKNTDNTLNYIKLQSPKNKSTIDIINDSKEYYNEDLEDIEHKNYKKINKILNNEDY